MALTVTQSGAAATSARLRAVTPSIDASSLDGVNAAAAAAQQKSIDRTYELYNLSVATISQYVTVAEATSGKAGARVTLQVRAIPIEAFDPQIRMQTFSYTDAKGRNVTRLLPTVWLTRLRGNAPAYISAAFPLHTRSNGGLVAGDKIRRRIGKGKGAAARSNLTRLRYYTFPNAFLQKDLLPLLRSTIGTEFGVSFKAAFRRLNKSGNAVLVNN